ncbi:hypothetical protein LTR27_007744 [Elasticomyces elasticus]|nr:hypothetical protein LTR27_007744 [Elasticomyces elasticus]
MPPSGSMNYLLERDSPKQTPEQLARLPPPQVMASTSTALPPGFKELFLSGLYSDLTIVCGKCSFKVHKCVLHAQSSVFRTMLGGKFKEADQSVLTLEHDRPDVLAVLLQYSYHSSLPATSTVDDRALGEFTVLIYAIADKYDVPGLRDLAAAKLTRILVPVQYSVKLFCAALIAIDEYTADNTLWDIVVPKILTNISWLVNCEEFFELVQEMPVLNKVLLVGRTEGSSSTQPKFVFKKPASSIGQEGRTAMRDYIRNSGSGSSGAGVELLSPHRGVSGS